MEVEDLQRRLGNAITLAQGIAENGGCAEAVASWVELRAAMDEHFQILATIRAMYPYGSVAVTGRTCDGHDVELPVFGDGTRDGKKLYIVALPAGVSSDVLSMVGEVARAKSLWPPFNSAHEGYAVLAEEVDELWDEVKVNQKKRDLPKMKQEAKQVGAMAIRFMSECCDEVTGRK